MGMSRFEALKAAVEEQAKMTEAGASDKVLIETLEAELAEIDADTNRRINEIKATPINKDILKKGAETQRDSLLKANERDYKTIVMSAEQEIKQAELDADNTYKQAQLDIDKEKATLINIKERAQEKKDRDDIAVNEEYERIIASIGNVEKTIELKVQREVVAGDKRKQEIQIKLRGLKARDKVADSKRAIFTKFYNDVVDISKQKDSEK
jgi:hypothetical protein